MISAKNNHLRHIAIIMDGNGRWAKNRLKSRIFGHRNSISSVDDSIEYCSENGIAILTLFAFGRDNWSRPSKEVDDLMDLFCETLKDKAPQLHESNISLKVVGDKTRLSSKLLNIIAATESLTSTNTGLDLRLAVDYSGKWDIVEAVKVVVNDVQEKKFLPDTITEEVFSSYLISGDVPVDLLIRTSGEVRLSDFMLWQLAYSEMYFTDVMWPDFSKNDLNNAVQYFYSRQRRFGKSSEQIK